MPNIGEIVVQTGVQMRPRDIHDHYQTDENCLRAYLARHPLPKNDLDIILDPGCGTGVYGKVLQELYPESTRLGIELNTQRFPDPGYYTHWLEGDFLYKSIVADTVIGNPPYKHAEEFFWQALDGILHNGTRYGTVDFLLRLGFLGSSRRHESMWSRGYRPTKVTVCSTRPSFTGDGKTYPTEFAFFRWNIENGVCDQRGELDFLIFERDSNGKSSRALEGDLGTG